MHQCNQPRLRFIIGRPEFCATALRSALNVQQAAPVGLSELARAVGLERAAKLSRAGKGEAIRPHVLPFLAVKLACHEFAGRANELADLRLPFWCGKNAAHALGAAADRRLALLLLRLGRPLRSPLSSSTHSHCQGLVLV
ncbi:hypothetical protein [Ralstonia sp.]|uniref:hypothetical protein n=1 Tax=Ralstonia sp. TaxID=54061 RepID=UPI00257D52CB|nr:hypothetical protein [Ralstonia sp.]